MKLQAFYNRKAIEHDGIQRWMYTENKTRCTRRWLNNIEMIKTMVDSKSVLDIGCAEGWLSNQCFLCGAKLVVGLDVSEQSLRRAVNKDEILYVCGYAEHIPFPDDSFDIVLMFEVLEHVEDIDRTLKEAGRVGGKLLISVPINEAFIDEHLQVQGHLRVFTLDDAKALLSTVEHFTVDDEIAYMIGYY